MSITRQLWCILTPLQRRRALLLQLISLCMAGSTMTGIAAIAPFFAVLGDPQQIERIPLLHWLYLHSGNGSVRQFEVALGVCFALLLCAANLVTALGSLALIRIAGSISSELQITLFAEYLARPYLFHTRTHSAQLFNNLVLDTTRGINEVLQSIFLLVTNCVTASLILVSIILVSPPVALLMVLTLVGGYLLIYLLLRERLLRAGRDNSQRLLEQIRLVNETLAAIRDVVLQRAQGLFQQQFARSSRDLTRAVGNTQAVAQMPRQAMECVAVIALVSAALLISGGRGEIAGSLGELTFLGFAAYRLLPALQQAFTALVRIRTEQSSFRVVAQDLYLARTRVASAVEPALDWHNRPQHTIRLDDVGFRYDPERPCALSGVTLTIPARMVVGIVGPNGAGKTTLADVVAGLLSPDSGTLSVDGTTITDDNRAAWQQCIAYVPQQTFLLDTTLAQNVALGVPEDQIDRERLRRALQLAQLDELVEALPRGCEQRVGERGVTLSGGQRQRLSIARALYRNASVLILDEATSALDGLTEQELMSALQRLRGQCTLVLIAHRLGALRSCDVIFELQAGALRDGGTYAELLARSSALRAMAEAG